MVNVQGKHKRPQPLVPETLSNGPGLTPRPFTKQSDSLDWSHMANELALFYYVA